MKNINLNYLNSSNYGHLLYLFPMLTKTMEVMNDIECRKAIREALDKMFKEF